MKRTLILALIFAVALPAAALEKTPPKTISSVWTDAPIQVDGKTSEWPADSFQTNPERGMRFAFRNNERWLYAVVVFDDLKFLSTASQTGLTVWINGEGREKKSYGLRFARKAMTPEELIKDLEQRGETLTDQRKTELRSRPSYIVAACDFLDKKGKVISRPELMPGGFRDGREGKSFVFEFSVPIASLNDPAAKTALVAGQPFKAGFEWGGLTDAMRRARLAGVGNQSARAAEGGGGDVGGYLGEGNEYMNRDSGASLDSLGRAPKKYDFWFDLALAEKK